MDDDVQLMQAFQNGDEQAFEALFDRWATRLLRFLVRMVKDTAVAEELVQETFLRVHRARERYSPEARFSTWLFTIAGNAARNELRRPFRRHAHDRPDDGAANDEGPTLQLVSDAPATDDVAHARRVGDAVDAAFARIPERQRAALWLSAVEGQSYAEIARALDTSEKSVKALVHRARVSLSKFVTPEGEPVSPAATAERGGSA